MTEHGGAERASGGERTRVRAEAVRSSYAPRGEIMEEDARVIGTFHLPTHHPDDVKYHVGRRTLTLWSRKQGHEFQTILVLPRWVNPQTYLMTHKNGVYEFVFHQAEEPPRPAAARPGP